MGASRRMSQLCWPAEPTGKKRQQADCLHKSTAPAFLRDPRVLRVKKSDYPILLTCEPRRVLASQGVIFGFPVLDYNWRHFGSLMRRISDLASALWILAS